MLYNMKDLLKVAVEHQFAVPAFNISNYSMLNGIFDICEQLRAPLIVAIHPLELDHTGYEMVTAIREKAQNSNLPVCIHLDHGDSFASIIKAIKYGFTSVMIDGSMLSFEENIELCQKVVQIAAPVQVSVEGELGTIGSVDNQAEAGTEQIIYTKPKDAKELVDRTGIDTLAIAIGTSHGIYPEGKEPKLRLDLLQEIRQIIDIPLVLHGGSGNPDSEIAEAVKIGIDKINISSDIKNAYFEKMRQVLMDKTLREPNRIEPICEQAMKEVAQHKIRLFNAEDKVKYYH